MLPMHCPSMIIYALTAVDINKIFHCMFRIYLYMTCYYLCNEIFI